MKKELVEFLVQKFKWEEWQVELGLRANFSCEYCGKYLLQNVDYYYEWQTDHINPQKNGGDNNLENLALCCKNCNFLKRNHYPDEDLDNKTREDKIRYFKTYIY
jgi:5-methylcytosine-specific restriction endonuclease McrA